MTVRFISCLSVSALFLLMLSCCSAQGQDPQVLDEKANGIGRPVDCRSVYLGQSIRFVIDHQSRDVHRIYLKGVLGGKAELTLDGNRCTKLSPFGDPAACTEALFSPIPVMLTSLRLADPSGKRRQIYQVTQTPLLNYMLRLVVPVDREEPIRLLLLSVDGKAVLQVLTLECSRQ